MFISKVILLLRYYREDATKILVLMINTRNAAIDWKQEIHLHWHKQNITIIGNLHKQNVTIFDNVYA